jgi:hypothetical protein
VPWSPHAPPAGKTVREVDRIDRATPQGLPASEVLRQGHPPVEEVLHRRDPDRTPEPLEEHRAREPRLLRHLRDGPWRGRSLVHPAQGRGGALVAGPSHEAGRRRGAVEGPRRLDQHDLRQPRQDLTSPDGERTSARSLEAPLPRRAASRRSAGPASCNDTRRAAAWGRTAHPDGEVVARDLIQADPPFVTAPWRQANLTLPGRHSEAMKAVLRLDDKAVDEALATGRGRLNGAPRKRTGTGSRRQLPAGANRLQAPVPVGRPLPWKTVEARLTPARRSSIPPGTRRRSLRRDRPRGSETVRSTRRRPPMGFLRGRPRPDFPRRLGGTRQD